MEELNDKSNETQNQSPGHAFPNRNAKWISGISGGVASAIVTVLLLVIPVINSWLSNVKEVSLAQVKNSADQIAYITKRMEDSDRERDLYKGEMISCQKEMRQLQLQCKK